MNNRLQDPLEPRFPNQVLSHRRALAGGRMKAAIRTPAPGMERPWQLVGGWKISIIRIRKRGG